VTAFDWIEQGSVATAATLAAAAVLMMAHWVFARLAFRLSGLSRVLEGHPRQLVANGLFDRRQMSRALVSGADMREALRLRTDRETSRASRLRGRNGTARSACG
jgi:uncharacterized membrane protein YcaP (DUF421 family)